MKRWTFYFNEGSVTNDPLSQEESDRIDAITRLGQGMLSLANERQIVHINLNQVKCAVMQEIEEVKAIEPAEVIVIDQYKAV